MVDELQEIPGRYTRAGKPVDLMLVHLGGTTIPGPSVPLLMVTMDAKQGIELIQLVQPDVTIPIHYECVLLYLLECIFSSVGLFAVTMTSSSARSRISRRPWRRQGWARKWCI